MLAFGAGGLDVAVAMGGGAYRITMPKVIKVELSGRLPYMVSAKDVILKVLEILSVKGGVGYIVEYAGEGVKTLSVPERATITNMGAELGASTSVFPSDERTLEFLEAQGRGKAYKPISADADAEYDKVIKINLCILCTASALKVSVECTQGNSCGIRREAHTYTRTAGRFQNSCACRNNVSQSTALCKHIQNLLRTGRNGQANLGAYSFAL